ncbi:hypothetical protein JCM33374_g2597 [Metschnikowia sp. JCM 33374]|nr:hypothetical protein JCM33374_g2597 [Metschnikowia sp. JCM 33374]
MATQYARISSKELDEFLTDVHRNIEHDAERDDSTDFKKLTLFLFGFASAKLSVLMTRADTEALRFVSRIFSAIELVLSKRKSLLNTDIQPAELYSIYMEAPSHSRPAAPVVFFEWSVDFAIQWFSQFPEDLELTNSIKSFLIGLINIATVHLRGLKHKKTLRTQLLTRLESNVDRLYQHVRSEGSGVIHPLGFGPLLCTTTHLFTILNDYDISSKLILHTVYYKHRFESYAKKLSFAMSTANIISADALSSDASLRLLDTSKSVLLLNLTSNIVLDKAAKWSSIELILGWIHQHFTKLYLARSSLTPSMGQYNRVTCVSLMKIFIFCRSRNALSSFFNSFLLSSFDVSTLLPDDKIFPAVVSKTLQLLHLQNTSIDSSSIRFLAPIAPFMDAELDDLRSDILSMNDSGIMKQLQFIVDKSQTFKTFISRKESSGTLGHPTIKTWLKYITALIQKKAARPQNPILEDRSTLYTLLSALRDVPCIIAGDFDFGSAQCMHCTTLSNKNLYEAISVKRKQISEVNEAMILYTTVFCEYLLKSKGERLFNDSLLATNFLLALFNLLATYRLPDRDCKPNHPTVQFVLRCLVSHHNRDVRILAARVVPLFFIREVDQNSESLFQTIYGTLSRIKYSSALGNLHMAESTMLAISELAIICDGEWLCVIFIKLMLSLGESNDQHVNLAYNSIIYIGSAKAMTPYKLLTPYLPSIAEIIIQNTHMFTRLTKLLGVSKEILSQ